MSEAARLCKEARDLMNLAIKEIEAKEGQGISKEQQIAVTLAFLSAGIEHHFRHRDDTAFELYGDGGIEFVYALYEYARVINEVYNDLPEKEGPGVFDYEFTEEITGTYLAKCLINNCALPGDKDFRNWCRITMTNWVYEVYKV